MRIVAVCTRDHTFLDAVLEGHRELYAHIGMAPFAERGLGLAQQRASGLRAMNRMATGACHPIQSVLRTPYIRSRQRLAVAAQAGVNDALGGKFRERDNGRFTAVIIDVIAAGTVASLATRVLRCFLTRSEALEMGIFIECVPGDRVAHFAGVIIYKVIGLLLLRTRDEDAGAEYCQKQP